MKKQLFTMLAIAVPALLLAQAPSLNQWNLPRIGATKVDYVAEGNGIEPGASGANVTWDFTHLTADFNNTKIESPIVAPGTTPYASHFQNANAASRTVSGQGYGYLKLSSTQVEMVGYAANQQGKDVVQKFTDPIVQMKLPFTFNDAFTDKFRAEFDVEGVEFIRNGTITVNADGYGTLKMPGVTANDVLRLHSVIKQKDSSDLFGMAYELVIESETWTYLVAGRMNPVLTITETTTITFMDGDEMNRNSSKLVTFNTSGGVASAGENISNATEMKLYPNPARNFSTLTFVSDVRGDGRITILNALGQQALPAQKVHVTEGINTQLCPVESLSPGIYFLQLQLNGQTVTQKLVVE